MKLKLILLSVLLLNAFILRASGTDTLKIFYNINKYELSSADKLKINNGIDSLSTGDTIRVLGYADYLGTEKPNLALSTTRAETIKSYIQSIKSDLVILTEGKGEVPASTARLATGEPVNRRVDIVFKHRLQPKTPIVVVPKPMPIEVKAKPVEVHRDTVRERPPQITATGATPADNKSFSEKINGLDKLDVGSSISLEELTFQPGRHFLNPEAVRYVNKLLKYLKNHPNIRFEILGHICCEVVKPDGQDFDTGEYTLSVNRAKFIYDYFIKSGISADRMTYKGLGHSKPKVFPELSEHDRYLNRRVEIMITGK